MLKRLKYGWQYSDTTDKILLSALFLLGVISVG